MKKRWLFLSGLLILLLAAGFFTISNKNEIKESWQDIKQEQSLAKNENEFIQFVYNGMLAGKDEIQVLYYGVNYKEIHNEFLDRIIHRIFEMDDKKTSDDADYLRYNLNEVRINTQSYLFNIVSITILPKWKESMKETEIVNKKVKEILKSLKLEKDSDYEKIRKIHDYIVQNFEYDEELNNYTVFNGLKDGSMICQGYMLLAYKMLTEAGIETKCIDGTGSSPTGTQSHGWNLVKLGEYWYNIDTTWDDPVWIGDTSAWEDEGSSIQYSYFLKGSDAFNKDHASSAEFLTADFMEQYPISKHDYDTSSDPLINQTKNKN